MVHTIQHHITPFFLCMYKIFFFSQLDFSTEIRRSQKIRAEYLLPRKWMYVALFCRTIPCSSSKFLPVKIKCTYYEKQVVRSLCSRENSLGSSFRQDATHFLRCAATEEKAITIPLSGHNFKIYPCTATRTTCSTPRRRPTTTTDGPSPPPVGVGEATTTVTPTTTPTSATRCRGTARTSPLRK